MPEGPSIVIVKENLASFRKKTVREASGTSKLDYDRLQGATIKEFRTWGKHFLMVFNGFTVRIHFLMFGTYLIDERKKLKERLHLVFKDGHELNFYTCAVKWIEGNVKNEYDWSEDVMSDEWNVATTRRRLKAHSEMMACDALMDQHLFSGVGNIIKNEVLFRIRVHPEALLKNLPTVQLTSLIKEARLYSLEFLHWKKLNQLKKHWLIYSKKTCPRCNIPVIRKPTGKSKRGSFFCTNCQELYQRVSR